MDFCPALKKIVSGMLLQSGFEIVESFDRNIGHDKVVVTCFTETRIRIRDMIKEVVLWRWDTDRPGEFHIRAEIDPDFRDVIPDVSKSDKINLHDPDAVQTLTEFLRWHTKANT